MWTKENLFTRGGDRFRESCLTSPGYDMSRSTCGGKDYKKKKERKRLMLNEQKNQKQNNIHLVIRSLVQNLCN